MKNKKSQFDISFLVLVLSLVVIIGCCPAAFSFENEDPETFKTALEYTAGTMTPLDYTFETGWWKFDEGVGNNTVDSAGGNQNGTRYEATWSSDSKVGTHALEFDGIDDYVDIDYDLPNMDFTMCAWYKTESSWVAIISEGLGGESQGTNVQSLLIWDDVQIGLRSETGSGTNHDYTFTPSGNIVDGQWHFIAAIIISGNLVMYWDDQKFTTSMVNTDTLASNCWVGCYGGPSTGNYINGSIDDVRIYESALTDEEISWLYNNGAGRNEKLNDHEYKIGWWKMDEGAGSIAEDSIDGDQNGTIYGAAWTSNSKVGNYALMFDGVDDCVDTNYNLPNVGYTMSAWYKTTVGGKRNIISEGLVGESRSTNTQELCLFSDTEIGFKTETGSSGTNHDYAFTPGNIIDGEWHFVAAIVTSGTLEFYWDDQKFTTSIINSDTNSDNLCIGNYGGVSGGAYFNGTIDDVRIYERILSDNEIAWIYNEGRGSVAPEITINSPTPNEVVGSIAPSYDIAITGLYDSIWYTFNGGVTNFTVSSLTGALNQAAWAALPDGIMVITFFANYSAELEGNAQVQVIKDTSEEPSPTPAGIPGYNLYLLLGALGIITAFIVRKRLKS
ncbi:MAG: LamG domain-containing protein [Candidatus Hermodarchaeota archaeon]